MLAIEVDGYSHEFLEVYNKDVIKEKRLNQLGITVLRFSDKQVLKDTENVLRAIECFIVEFEKGMNDKFRKTAKTHPQPLS